MWKTIQLITEDEHMDLDCVEILFDELNLYYRSYTPSAAVPRSHHRHIADLGNFSYIHEYKRAGRKSNRHIIHQYQVTVISMSFQYHVLSLIIMSRRPVFRIFHSILKFIMYVGSTAVELYVELQTDMSIQHLISRV